MQIVGSFIDKCFSLSRLGKCWYDRLIAGIIEAGRTISYVETTTPTQADTLHLAIKGGDFQLFAHEFEQVVRFSLPKLHVNRVKVVFDTTEEVTWCKSGFRNLRPSVYDKPEESWQFLNMSIVQPCFIPLMSVPYRRIDDLDTLVIGLLGYLSTLPLIVELIIFDKGFYHAHLIDYLNAAQWPYLISVSEREAQRKYIQQTRDAKQSLGVFHHEFDYKKDMSSWNPTTKIMVRIVDETTAWCYATNLQPSLALCGMYPQRWGIETGFRVHDEARIKSKSLNIRIRFFYHLLSMLLVLLWRLQSTQKPMVFKRYLKFVEAQYSPVQKVPAQPPPL